MKAVGFVVARFGMLLGDLHAQSRPVYSEILGTALVLLEMAVGLPAVRLRVQLWQTKQHATVEHQV